MDKSESVRDTERQAQLEEVYSGKVDWNEIYRRFHPPREIAKRLAEYFPRVECSKLVMCGFAEVALEMQNLGYQISYVEYSREMTEAARFRYPGLQSIIHEDILSFLQDDTSTDLALVCRISAYWQSKSDFERLLRGVESSPRRRILIDFYDRDAVKEGTHRYFQVEGGKGSWEFLSFSEHSNSSPRIEIAKMNVEYSFGEDALQYIAYRSHLRRQEIEAFFQKLLPNAQIRIAESLLPGDTSFLLIIDFAPFERTHDNAG